MKFSGAVSVLNKLLEKPLGNNKAYFCRIYTSEAPNLLIFLINDVTEGDLFIWNVKRMQGIAAISKTNYNSPSRHCDERKLLSPTPHWRLMTLLNVFARRTIRFACNILKGRLSGRCRRRMNNLSVRRLLPRHSADTRLTLPHNLRYVMLMLSCDANKFKWCEMINIESSRLLWR